MVMNEQKNDWQSDLYKGFGQKIKSDIHETWKCVNAELQRQIRCFPYAELSDVPWLQQVEKKAVGRQRNLGLEIVIPVESNCNICVSYFIAFC